jgi:bacillithiol system protein YtxJ
MSSMHWNKLTSIDQLGDLKLESKEKYVMIFKHSTRCSISAMVLNRLERNWNDEETKQIVPYYLDLIEHRDISNAIEDIFNEQHESPQVLLIKDGASILNKTHMAIDYNTIIERIKS